MSKLENGVKALETLKVQDVHYVPVDAVLSMISKHDQENKPKEQYDDVNCTPSVKETIRYFFTRSVLLFPPLWLLILLSPDILSNFGIVVQIPNKLYELIKIFVVLPFAIALNQTAIYYFKDCQNDMETDVPSAKTIVRYITQSWILYVLLSTTMFLYAVNFEALGMDVIKDIVGTLNVASWLFGLGIFTMWRWFRKEYHFLFSSNKDNTDSNSTWDTLTPIQKTAKSLAILFFVIWTLTNIYIQLSQQ